MTVPAGRAENMDLLFPGLFDSVAGLCILAVLIAMGVFLFAAPFVAIAKLIEIHRSIEKLRAEMEERDAKLTHPLATINRNLGHILLKLPRIFPELADNRPQPRASGTEPERRPG
jgi:hypothetical protein